MRKALGVAPAATNDEVTKAYVDAATTGLVHLAGAETITGIKSFTATPTVANAPVNPTDAVNKTYHDANEWIVTTVGTAVDINATVGRYYRVDAATATGAINFNLPTGQRNGARIILDVLGGDFGVWPVAGGTDTVYPSSATFIAVNEMVELVYNGAGIWFARQYRVRNTAGAMVRRDNFGRAQVSDPSAAADIATKNYVDTAKYFEQGNLNNITLVSGWQNIGTGTTTVYGTEGKHIATATGITTIPFTGVYSMSACVLTATVATAGRCVLQFALTAATGSPLFRAEGSNSTNSTAGLTVSGMQRLAAGATLYCQVFASGGFIGAALTGETISVGLMFLSA